MGEYLATRGSFINGRYVPRGFPVTVDDRKVKPGQKNLVPAGKVARDVVQISAVAPTGPNPTRPQQVPPDATQTVEGHVQPGALLVGETTDPKAVDVAEQAKQDATGAQARVAETLAGRSSQQAEAEALLDDGEDEEEVGLADGTIPEVVARIDKDTDLDALEEAENDRDKPHAGVLNAIQAERERRLS